MNEIHEALKRLGYVENSKSWIDYNSAKNHLINNIDDRYEYVCKQIAKYFGV